MLPLNGLEGFSFCCSMSESIIRTSSEDCESCFFSFSTSFLAVVVDCSLAVVVDCSLAVVVDCSLVGAGDACSFGSGASDFLGLN